MAVCDRYKSMHLCQLTIKTQFHLLHSIVFGLLHHSFVSSSWDGKPKLSYIPEQRPDASGHPYRTGRDRCLPKIKAD